MLSEVFIMRRVYHSFIKLFYKWSLILGLLWVNGYVLAGAPPENQQPSQRSTQKTSISERYFQKFRPEVLSAYHAYIQSKEDGSVPTSTALDIPKLVEREREHADDYYVFYHGQKDHHRILQDFWLSTMEIMQLSPPNSTQNFIPLRLPDPHAFKPISPENFIQDMKSKELSDSNFGISKRLLSSNIALFGNHEKSGESSFCYYFDNQSDYNHALRSMLEDSFEYYDFNPKFIEYLIDHRASINTGRGSLLQIFIPKQIVDQCAYLSQPYGHPFTEDVSLEGYDETLKYQKKISAFLQACEADKVLGDTLQYAQARILITQDIMLNPQSGVKIFRETALPEDKTTHHAQQMDLVSTQIMIDWLNRYLNPGNNPDQQIKPEALERIKDTPFGQLIADKQRAQALFHRLYTTNSLATLLPLEGDKKLLHA